MCGIAGILNGRVRSEAALVQAAVSMADAIAHRGPDGSGTWADPESGIALSHRRLAVIDLTAAGAQPMHSRSGRYVISYNGEIYNFNELRRLVEDARPNSKWRGHSDTEVLIEAIDHWGFEATLSRLDGMFALAVWDRQTRALSLARDRFGEKPLYYGIVDGAFLFGSELRALRTQVRLGDSDVDLESLEWLFQTSYVPAPRSIFRQVSKLPPASWLTVQLEDLTSGRQPQVRTYWDAMHAAGSAAENPYDGTPEDIADRVSMLLEDSIRLRLVADVPIGAMLSGGIDSTCIAAIGQSLSTKPLRTFTVGFSDADYDESESAAVVAKVLGTDHTMVRVGVEEILAAVPMMAQTYDEPFADSSQVPTYLLSRALRQEVTVALSGDGGDELFGGYHRYSAGPGLWRRLSMAPHPVRKLGAQFLSLLGPSFPGIVAGAMGARGEAAGRIQKALGLLDARSTDDLYARLTSHWPGDTAVSMFGAAVKPSLLRPDRPSAATDFARNMMLSDTAGYLPNDILTKVDRASMKVALEVRPPFLSAALFEFAWSLPTNSLFRDGVGKQPLRRLAERHVPQSIVTRRKQGFVVPFGNWLRGPLKAWASDVLSPSRLARTNFYNTARIEKAWEQHKSGAIDNSMQLWPILMFEEWRNTLH